LVHEGGYSEVYVPFCGHAIMEALSGHNLVGNPALEIFKVNSYPKECMTA